MIKLILGISGIIFGLILGKITTEEIKFGKKYFSFSKIILITAILLINIKKNILLTLFLIILILITSLKIKNETIKEIISYSMIIFIYFSNPIYQNLTASLTFIYSLITGSLIWLKTKT